MTKREKRRASRRFTRARTSSSPPLLPRVIARRRILSIPLARGTAPDDFTAYYYYYNHHHISFLRVSRVEKSETTPPDPNDQVSRSCGTFRFPIDCKLRIEPSTKREYTLQVEWTPARELGRARAIATPTEFKKQQQRNTSHIHSFRGRALVGAVTSLS